MKVVYIRRVKLMGGYRTHLSNTSIHRASYVNNKIKKKSQKNLKDFIKALFTLLKICYNILCCPDTGKLCDNVMVGDLVSKEYIAKNTRVAADITTRSDEEPVVYEYIDQKPGISVCLP